jgi:hypothetical protein
VVLIGAKGKRCPRRCRGLQTQVCQTLSMAGVFGGEAIMLIRREAAGRDRLPMAGTGQSGVQVGRRKPVIQGGPGGKILSRSPRAGFGRVEPSKASDSSPETCRS